MKFSIKDLLSKFDQIRRKLKQCYIILSLNYTPSPRIAPTRHRTKTILTMHKKTRTVPQLAQLLGVIERPGLTHLLSRQSKHV